MEERAIATDQAARSFELPPLDHRYLGDWAPFGADHVAWGASFTAGDRLKSACFVHALTGKLVKKLTSPGGTQGPVVSDDHVVFGGGANGATVGVFARDTLKKAGSLKGHKSQLNGLTSLGDRYVTLGGRNSSPFDDTVRVWDPATLQETARVKLAQRPQVVAAACDRIYVHSWAYQEETHLHALDGSGQVLWSLPNGEAMNVTLSLTSDGSTLAMVRADELLFLDPDGEVKASCSVAEAGRFRMAGSWGAPAFSSDDRWLFLTPEYDRAERGTIVIDVEKCVPVLRLCGVVRPAPFGDGYGAWLGTEGPVTHFGVLPRSLVEP